ARTFAGVDPVKSPIPVCPAVHYTMGGITCDVHCATPLPGLFAAGECASVGIHGANRLGSNSLTELLVFGKVAGEQALQFARQVAAPDTRALRAQAEAARAAALALMQRKGPAGSRGERIATILKEMARSMEEGCGIYRSAETLQATCTKLAELKQRLQHIELDDRSRAWNTEWLTAIELGFLLDVAEAMAHSALHRRESRGSHQRLDGFEARDDTNFLKHSLAYCNGQGAPRIDYSAVKITSSPPGTRAYGAAGEQAEAERKAKEKAHV
ncbi:MAG: fumarate reductase, flavoprotein subunit, partial [Pseudomonadota bacterium]